MLVYSFIYKYGLPVCTLLRFRLLYHVLSHTSRCVRDPPEALQLHFLSTGVIIYIYVYLKQHGTVQMAQHRTCCFRGQTLGYP